jgi:uncharacterized protein DUF6011
MDPRSIPTGEYLVDGQVVRVTRNQFDTITVHADHKWLGTLTAAGASEGARGRRVLEALTSGPVVQVVRCSNCGIPLTDPASRARRRGPECQAKLVGAAR